MSSLRVHSDIRVEAEKTAEADFNCVHSAQRQKIECVAREKSRQSG
jgi:hypothetical protein